MTKFTKADLKDGMIVRTRTTSFGHEYMVLGQRLLRSTGHLELNDYDNALSDKDDTKWDIVEVLETSDLQNNLNIDTWKLKSIWKREDEEAKQKEIDEIRFHLQQLQDRLAELENS